jgi:hypothetical protein
MLTLNLNSKSSVIRRKTLVQDSALLPVECGALLAAAWEQAHQDQLAYERAYEDAYVKAYCG